MMLKRLLAIRRYWFWALAALAMILLVWPPSLFFLGDDFDGIPVFASADFFHNRGTRFVAAWSEWADYQLYGRKAWGYLLSNLLLHIACCWLAWRVLGNMIRQAGHQAGLPWLAWAVAGFGVYAFHSEVLFWISARTASWCLLFYLLAWLCLWKGEQRHSIWAYAGASVCMLLGLLSYETILLLPLHFVSWYILLGQARQKRKHLLLGTLSLLVALGIYLPLRHYITYEWVGTYEAREVMALNLPAMAKNIGGLLIRTVAPPMSGKWLTLAIGVVVWVLLASMAGWLHWRKKTNALWRMLLLCWITSYALFGSLGIDLSGYESDRYLYMVSLFFMAWLMYSVYLLPWQGRQWLALGIIACHVGLLAQALHHYRLAGRVTREVVQTIQMVAAAERPNTMQVTGYPHKIYGIPVFKLNMLPGVQWLYPQATLPPIQLGQSKEMRAAQLPLYTTYSTTMGDTLVLHFYPEPKP